MGDKEAGGVGTQGHEQHQNTAFRHIAENHHQAERPVAREHGQRASLLQAPVFQALGRGGPARYAAAVPANRPPC